MLGSDSHPYLHPQLQSDPFVGAWLHLTKNLPIIKLPNVNWWKFGFDTSKLCISFAPRSIVFHGMRSFERNKFLSFDMYNFISYWEFLEIIVNLPLSKCMKNLMFNDLWLCWKFEEVHTFLTSKTIKKEKF